MMIMDSKSHSALFVWTDGDGERVSAGGKHIRNSCFYGVIIPEVMIISPVDDICSEKKIQGFVSTCVSSKRIQRKLQLSRRTVI